MNISCDIIRDILPLYAEDMVCDATKEFVDGHLCECPGCTRELETLRKPQKLPLEADVTSLKRVGDAIRRRRILAVMAVLLFIATVLLGAALLLDAKIYLSAGDAVEEIWVEEDCVKIRWHDGITGTTGAVETENPTNYAVTAWTCLQNVWFPSERVPYEQLDDEVKSLITEEQYALFDSTSSFSLPEGSEGTNFVYVDPSEHSMTLILNAGQPLPNEPLMEVYGYTKYYVIGMAALCAFCCLVGLVYKGKWYGELAGRLAILFGSLALSVVIVTAGQFLGINGDFQEALADSTAVAVPMCLCGLCILQLVKLNRQDRGL